jgi:hypothetical protein
MGTASNWDLTRPQARQRAPRAPTERLGATPDPRRQRWRIPADPRALPDHRRIAALEEHLDWRMFSSQRLITKRLITKRLITNGGVLVRDIRTESPSFTPASAPTRTPSPRTCRALDSGAAFWALHLGQLLSRTGATTNPQTPRSA